MRASPDADGVGVGNDTSTKPPMQPGYGPILRTHPIRFSFARASGPDPNLCTLQAFALTTIRHGAPDRRRPNWHVRRLSFQQGQALDTSSTKNQICRIA